MKDLLKRPRLTAALAIFVLAVATIGGAWIFQAFGYAPCELCLTERLPYYTGIVVAALAIVFALRRASTPLKICFILLFVIFAGGAALGIYHAGVEYKFWPGPAGCTGSFHAAHSTAEFLKQLQEVKVVRCDEVALRVMGLSLAGWNVIISIALAIWALIGLRQPHELT
ncbi:MAG: disulfide bond formation protein B [Methylovirgula sp.]